MVMTTRRHSAAPEEIPDASSSAAMSRASVMALSPCWSSHRRAHHALVIARRRISRTYCHREQAISDGHRSPSSRFRRVGVKKRRSRALRESGIIYGRNAPSVFDAAPPRCSIAMCADEVAHPIGHAVEVHSVGLACIHRLHICRPCQ